MQPSLDGGYNPSSATDRLSGTYLHQSTTGAPEQRLLIIYEKQNPEQLNSILNLLRNEVDIPASQIVIEALVIEVDTNTAEELGLKYNLFQKRTATRVDGGIKSRFNSQDKAMRKWNSARQTGAVNSPKYDTKYTDPRDKTTYAQGYDENGVWGVMVPTNSVEQSAYYSNTYDQPTAIYGGEQRINPFDLTGAAFTYAGFSAELDAYVEDGKAEILSNPTILVLDGRQALIRIGTQIPNRTVVSTQYGSQLSISYIDTGIVLNIRPRISEDGSEVTMQTETIVSSTRPSSIPQMDAPEIESKTVQSFVRVADNTLHNWGPY